MARRPATHKLRTQPPPTRSSRVYVRVDLKDASLFRFLLEAHEHLGYATTLDRHAGSGAQGERRALLVCYTSPETEAEFRAFLARAGAEMELKVVSGPGLPGGWALGEGPLD